MLSKFRNKDWIRKYKFQFILSLCLIIAPFIVYLHLIFKSYQKNIEVLGYFFEIKGISFQALAWILLSDIASIIILIVLFLSTIDKWKYALIIPVVIYSENFIVYLNEVTDIFGVFRYFKYVVISGLVILLLVVDHRFFGKYRQLVLNLKITSLILESSTYELSEISKIISRRNEKFDLNSNSQVLQGLYNRKLHFDKLLKEIKRVSITDLIRCNSAKSVLAILLIILSLSLWFLHRSIPEGAMTYNLGFLTISSHGYNDVQIFIWVISRKVMVIVPMVIWFISYHSWWRYAVLSPLVLYLFQFWEAIQESYTNVDAYGNYKIFPFVLISIVLLLALSRIVRRYSQSLDAYDEISRQIEFQINKLGAERSGIGDYRKRFEHIRNKLVKDQADTKLTELVRLQQELQRKVVS